MTQSAFAEGIGVTQGNVSLYEKGQTVPPKVAKRVIELAASRGVALTYDDVYVELGVASPASLQAAATPGTANSTGAPAAPQTRTA